LAEAFPGSIYPRVFALANAASVMGVAGGPFMLGLAYDFADYSVAYSLAVATSLVAGAFILTAGPRPVRGSVGTS